MHLLRLAEKEGLIRRFAPHPLGALCASKLVSPICRTLLFMFEGSNSNLYTFSQLKLLSSNSKLAEREGFEPSKGYKPLLVFKTSAFNRSATSPNFVDPVLLYLVGRTDDRSVLHRIQPSDGALCLQWIEDSTCH